MNGFAELLLLILNPHAARQPSQKLATLLLVRFTIAAFSYEYACGSNPLVITLSHDRLWMTVAEQYFTKESHAQSNSTDARARSRLVSGCVLAHGLLKTADPQQTMGVTRIHGMQLERKWLAGALVKFQK